MDNLLDYISEWDTHVKDQKKAIKSSDWYELKTLKERKDKHDKLISHICESTRNRISYLNSEFNVNEHIKDKKVKAFCKLLLSILSEYESQSRVYKSNNPWSSTSSDFEDLEDLDSDVYKDSEMRFHEDQVSIIVKNKKEAATINIDGTLDVSNLVNLRQETPFAPLVMHESIRKDFPKLDEYCDINNYTFFSPNDSPEMFINRKDVPPWDPNKHFFEQSKDAIQFFSEEFYKITEGVNINGVFIHPWLYFHLNFFKADIPYVDNLGRIKQGYINPGLRDNEWFFTENYMQAEAIYGQHAGQKKKGLCMVGSRRIAKSTIMGSNCQWLSLTQPNGYISITSGSSSDLSNMTKFISESMKHIHPAFRMYVLTGSDWDSKTTLGVKKTLNQTSVIHSTFLLHAVDGKSKRSNQKSAGGNPIGFIIDECGKMDWKEYFRLAKPAFQTPFGWKTVPILSATGGDIELSRDLESLCNNIENSDFIPMNWDLLESKIDPEYITWKRKPFATFVPAQMSYYDELQKIDTNLSEFLGVDGEDLKKVKIGKTDWKKAYEVINTDREKEKNDDDLRSFKMQYPIDPDEPFLVEGDSPFEVLEAKRHLKSILDSGDTGIPVEFMETKTGEIIYKMSDKAIAEFPFSGGNIDSPFIMFEEPPSVLPDVGKLYVSGWDGYKQSSSTTDSLGTLYILKRDGLINDPFSFRIVASISTRPKIMSSFFRSCHLGLKAYNAESLIERADHQSFVDYMKSKRSDFVYLTRWRDFAKKSTNKYIDPSEYGVTAKSIKNVAFPKVVAYCNEEVVVDYDLDGQPIMGLGVTRIKDVGLLNEIIKWKPGMNADRIISFGLALCLADYKTQNFVPVETGEASQQRFEMNESDKKRRKKKRNPFINRRSSRLR